MRERSIAWRRVRSSWWTSLGVLWIVDGILQAQPIMFSMDMVNSLMRTNTFGQPDWVAHPVIWTIGIWERAPVVVNLMVVALQLTIGVLILTGRERRLGRLGLKLTIVWGLVVWFFGEALGGLLSGTPSYVNGAPGAAALYVLLAVALLFPEHIWSQRPFLSLVRRGVGALWLIGAILQAQPQFWRAHVVATLFYSTVGNPQWSVLIASGNALIASIAAMPVVWNAGFVLVMSVIGTAALFGLDRFHWALLIMTGAWLAFIWWFGEGLGMIFTGMGTDPNTAILWAILMIPFWPFSVRWPKTVAP